MNLVVQPEPNLELALRRALPEAIKVGVDILREAGWTTQIQRAPDVAILGTSPLFKVADFTLQRRAEGWFDRVACGTVRVSNGLRRLSPAWALADMLQRYLDKRVRHAWLLAPDDLELDEAQADPESQAALCAFGLPPDAFIEHEYAAIFDSRPA